MSDINEDKGKAFSTFRKQLGEQEYRPVNEGAVKAAMEDWIESLPKAVVDEISRKYAAKLALPNLTGTELSKSNPVRKAIIQLLDKHKVKPLGDPSRENDIFALEMMFNGFFGESVEVSEENFNYGAYGYRIDKDGPNKFILYSLSYNQGSIRFPDGRKGTEIGTFKTKEEAIEKAKLRAEKTHPSARKSRTASVDEEWKSLKKTKADLDAIRKSGKRVSVQHGEGDTLYRVSKPKKSVKEEVEVSEEELTKVGYALVVDNKIVYRGNKKQCLKKAKEYGGLKFGKVFLTQTPKNIGQSWQKEEVNEAEQIDEASDKQKKNKLAHSNGGVKETAVGEETKKPWLRWSDKMAKVTLNPKTKIGYEIRDVGPGGKSTVVKRENWPKKKNKVKEDTEQVDEVLGDFNQHTLNIARKTVKMNDVFANIMGGMNKTQAHEFLLQHGTSAEKKASKKWLDEYDKVIKTLGGKPRE